MMGEAISSGSVDGVGFVSSQTDCFVSTMNTTPINEI